jgi:hypothetical protein
MPDPPLTIRRSRGTLIAERDGAPIAGISLTSGALTGSPTAGDVRALRHRRWQLLRHGV